jgi:hypothetical protein
MAYDRPEASAKPQSRRATTSQISDTRWCNTTADCTGMYQPDKLQVILLLGDVVTAQRKLIAGSWSIRVNN